MFFLNTVWVRVMNPQRLFEVYLQDASKKKCNHLFDSLYLTYFKGVNYWDVNFTIIWISKYQLKSFPLTQIQFCIRLITFAAWNIPIEWTAFSWNLQSVILPTWWAGELQSKSVENKSVKWKIRPLKTLPSHPNGYFNEACAFDNSLNY